MIAEILPQHVASCAVFHDLPYEVLGQQEEVAISGAVEQRRREFATVRACARTALARLGVPAAPIPRGQRGAPQWPTGVVGSMTHCEGYRAAAVALARDVAAIGIDAEPNSALPKEVLGLVSHPQERLQVDELASSCAGVHWDRLLFCAKEAVFKAWYPATRRELDFQDAVITIDASRGLFTARLLMEELVLDGRAIRELPGRWLSENGLLATSITIPRRL